MKSLNPGAENCRRNGVIGLGLMPIHRPTTINIKVSHGLNQYEVFVPSTSNFELQKKDDDEDLLTAGLTDNSEVLLMEGKANEQESPEENQETSVISQGEEAVAEIKKEVDVLAQRVSALQALVDDGIKVHDKEIVHLTEMLMRHLLKLDGIEAQGEGKVQRKMEVRRVQSMVETLDVLKSRNFSNTRRSLSDSKNVYASFPMPSSSKI